MRRPPGGFAYTEDIKGILVAHEKKYTKRKKKKTGRIRSEFSADSSSSSFSASLLAAAGGLCPRHQSRLRVLDSLILEPLAAVIKDPLGLELARCRQDFAVVAVHLACLGVEIPVAGIVCALRNLRRVLFVGEEGLAGRLQALFHLGV